MQKVAILAAILAARVAFAGSVVALGPERVISDFLIKPDWAIVGAPIPNEDGYLLLFNHGTARDHQQLRAAQIDSAGHPVRDWKIETSGANVAGKAGARAVNGNYVVNVSSDGPQSLVFLAPNGRDVVAMAALAPSTSVVALACGSENCLAVTVRKPAATLSFFELSVFSPDGRLLAGPAVFGRDFLSSPSVVADGREFRMTWQQRDGVVAATVDGAANVVALTRLSPRGAKPLVVMGDVPVYFYIDGYAIKGARVDQGPKTIVPVDPDYSSFAAAWNGSEFVIVLSTVFPEIEGCEAYRASVTGLRLTRTLDALDRSPLSIFSPPPISSSEVPAIASSHGDFLLIQLSGCNGYVAYLTHISANGDVDPPGIGRPVAEAGSVSPDFGPFGVDAAGLDVVIWGRQESDHYAVYATRSLRDGTPVDAGPITVANYPPYQGIATDGSKILMLSSAFKRAWLLDAATGKVTTSTVDFQGSHLIWNGSHYVSLSWDTLPGVNPNRYALSANQFNADGVLLKTTDVGRLSPVPPYIERIGLAAAGGRTLTLWMTADGIFSATLDENNAVVVALHKIAPHATDFTLASDGTSILVLSGTNNSEIRATIVSVNGEVIASAAIVSTRFNIIRLAAGHLGDRWLAAFDDGTGEHVVAFRTPSLIETAPLTMPSVWYFSFLSRGDGSAAALLPAAREENATLGPVTGWVAVKREVSVVTPRREAAKH